METLVKFIDTVRYGLVPIDTIFRDVKEMTAHGYVIPAESKDVKFIVNGKGSEERPTGFAAVPKKDRLAMAKDLLSYDSKKSDDDEPQMELSCGYFDS